MNNIAKTAVFKCPRCGEDKVFKRISKQTLGMITNNQSSAERIFLAICSLGVSEIPDKYYYECSRCGYILKKSAI